MTSLLVKGAIASMLSLSFAAAAMASEETHGGGHGSAMHGAPGKASSVSRTIDIVMHDNYFEPENIEVSGGETIRFRVRNAGEFVHEFNIGMASMHAAHQGEMQMMVDHGVLQPDRIDHAAAQAMQASMGHGMHDDANSVLLEPGKSGEVIWQFPEHLEGPLEFACNVPGHYGSGMVGDFKGRHGS